MSCPLPLVEDLSPPTVMVVSTLVERCAAIRKVVQSWAVPATMAIFDSPQEVRRHLDQAAPDLVVLDGELGEDQVLALVRHLRQTQAAVEVFTFAGVDIDPSFMVWPWAALPSVLNQWFEQYLERNSLDLQADWLV
jgi:CheY-like chemotaxis protein